MAKRRGPRGLKPGRETPQRRIKRPSPEAVAKIQRQRSIQAYNNLVKDRVQYLKTIVSPTVSYKSAKEAEAARKTLEKETGVVYKRTGKKLTQPKINSQTVRQSSEMKEIQAALKSKSSASSGRKAKALEQVGRRENYWMWAVGETPRT